MGGTVIYCQLGIAGGHQAVDQAGSEGIAAADAVQDLQVVKSFGGIDRSVRPADRFPVVDRGRFYGAQRGGDGFEVGELLCRFRDHLVIAVQVQLFQVLIVPFDLEAQAGSEVFLIADHDVHVFCHFPVDFPGFFQAADG